MQLFSVGVKIFYKMEDMQLLMVVVISIETFIVLVTS
jgi:hypothetical protein